MRHDPFAARRNRPLNLIGNELADEVCSDISVFHAGLFPAPPGDELWMDYRQATLAEAPALAAMNLRLIRDEGHRNQMTVAELEARMAGWLGGEYEAVLFSEAEQPVGYALYRRDPEYVYLRQFFVDSEFRRRGVGRAAIAWLLQNAWDGENRVRVEVLVGNAAGLAFWRAIGFVDYCLTLELEGFPAPDPSAGGESSISSEE